MILDRQPKKKLSTSQSIHHRDNIKKLSTLINKNSEESLAAAGPLLAFVRENAASDSPIPFHLYRPHTYINFHFIPLAGAYRRRGVNTSRRAGNTLSKFTHRASKQRRQLEQQSKVSHVKNLP